MPNEPDLTLVTTEAILNELMSRCDHGIASLMFIRRQDEETGEGDCNITRFWKGNNYTCAGLAQQMSYIVLPKDSRGIG